jgi:hypothetical protein
VAVRLRPATFGKPTMAQRLMLAGSLLENAHLALQARSRPC